MGRVSILLLVAACATPPPVRPGDPLERRGDEIAVCGRFFHTGARVVLWLDPDGYDAYRPHRHFEPEKAEPSGRKTVARYGSFRKGMEGRRLEDLQRQVDQVVIHYDAAGTSERCFKVLHDIRGLSAHFLLDRDGTIYQTLDLKERAWHAGTANDRSIGIEIANLGAYADPKKLASIAERVGLPGGEMKRGVIHGSMLHQYPFTEAQYLALGRLLATLCRVLPRIEPKMPRGVLLRDFAGFVGHYHITERKVDPGPAFDWERVLVSVRRNLE